MTKDLISGYYLDFIDHEVKSLIINNNMWTGEENNLALFDIDILMNKKLSQGRIEKERI